MGGRAETETRRALPTQTEASALTPRLTKNLYLFLCVDGDRASQARGVARGGRGGGGRGPRRGSGGRLPSLAVPGADEGPPQPRRSTGGAPGRRAGRLAATEVSTLVEGLTRAGRRQWDSGPRALALEDRRQTLKLEGLRYLRPPLVPRWTSGGGPAEEVAASAKALKRREYHSCPQGPQDVDPRSGDAPPPVGIPLRVRPFQHLTARPLARRPESRPHPPRHLTPGPCPAHRPVETRGARPTTSMITQRPYTVTP